MAAACRVLAEWVGLHHQGRPEAVHVDVAVIAQLLGKLGSQSGVETRRKVTQGITEAKLKVTKLWPKCYRIWSQVCTFFSSELSTGVLTGAWGRVGSLRRNGGSGFSGRPPQTSTKVDIFFPHLTFASP